MFSIAALDLEGRSTTELSALLGATVPAAWPPDFHDEGAKAWFRSSLVTHPGDAAWFGWYVIATIDGVPTLVGTAGFKGLPDPAGTVEIGYSIVAAYQRRGIGLDAVGQLVNRAFADDRVSAVTAETPVSFAASRGLLERSGFALTGLRVDAEEGELALYSVSRPDWIGRGSVETAR